MHVLIWIPFVDFGIGLIKEEEFTSLKRESEELKRREEEAREMLSAVGNAIAQLRDGWEGGQLQDLRKKFDRADKALWAEIALDIQEKIPQGIREYIERAWAANKEPNFEGTFIKLSLSILALLNATSRTSSAETISPFISASSSSTFSI